MRSQEASSTATAFGRFTSERALEDGVRGARVFERHNPHISHDHLCFELGLVTRLVLRPGKKSCLIDGPVSSRGEARATRRGEGSAICDRAAPRRSWRPENEPYAPLRFSATRGRRKGGLAVLREPRRYGQYAHQPARRSVGSAVRDFPVRAAPESRASLTVASSSSRRTGLSSVRHAPRLRAYSRKSTPAL